MSVADWIEKQAPIGRYTFSKEDVREAFPDMTPHAIDMAVQRAVTKGRIFSPCRGFYVVIPEEYRLWKAVPQEVYLDRMMQHLGRTYYVALSSAAERHGAAHQAPMGFQVMVEPPVLEELAPKLDFSRLDTSFLRVASAPVFQRLGYLLDRVLEEKSLADDLLGLMKSGGLKKKVVPLRLGASTEGAESDKKWKVLVNQAIEIDEL